ncbi:hypothetical protein VNO78_04384 [Psophocarpus tetragonolobus]|uniref:Uncharacterized protein n=1 Tax=Psophocarpus tetragonolobus TaxID=3891 RepID=A0AAN9T5G7_PSOTE
MAKADKTSQECKHRELSDPTFTIPKHMRSESDFNSMGKQKREEKNKKKTTLPEWRKGMRVRPRKKQNGNLKSKQNREGIEMDEKVLSLFLVCPLDFTEKEKSSEMGNEGEDKKHLKQPAGISLNLHFHTFMLRLSP